MWTKFKLWLHHTLNPHCPECEVDKCDAEARQDFCGKCEIYKGELAHSRHQVQQLIDSVIAKPAQSVETPYSMPTNFAPRTKSWAVRRQELENADKEAALARKSAVTADNLERELLPLAEVRVENAN